MDFVEEVASLVGQAERILFITGAGISADSGLPTYRGVGGLYEGQSTTEGMSIEEALSGTVFEVRPDITWKYLWQIGSACHGARPNLAHWVIASIQEMKPGSWVLTQNVDGLHRAAGSRNLIEVHGNAFEMFCCDCHTAYAAEELLEGYSGQPQLPPTCRMCNGVIRPDVVLFGEMLSAKVCTQLSDLSCMEFNLVMSIGTSGVFQYIIEPVVRAWRQGVPTVEVNPSETSVSQIVDYRVRLGAAEAMGRIWECLKSK